jgi:ketosteroid isomerase-like protein
MKIIVSVLASTFLATMAIAQEESPSPAESTAPTSEEKASATVEETPASAPSAETKKEEPMTATAPAKAQKKEATEAAAKPAASAAPAPSGKNLTGAAAIKDMENRWEAAVPTHNYSSVEGFVAADFTGVSAKGKFVNRSQMLAEFKGDKDTYKSAKNEKLNVMMYGPNVAVVTGRAREVGTGKDGKAFDHTFLFTDTWMMRGGKWQCVGSHIQKIKG